ncbi:hypothetical protein NQT62_05165 [Limnobacter humi]|uniref:Uncharacterized protein n=1 Tax=Limnobacter humi TaxID=1778671 RepID=A0ABT1WE75_9BURK|nr:hypothetical protein [Limnobacter humi]MCQ8895827.1 hypothetical protein [Limnobacter humi]
MASNPDVIERHLTLLERTQPGLGWFSLLQHQSAPHEFIWELRLNEYHSRCHREWLDYRWRFFSLAGSALHLRNVNQLDICLMRTFDSPEQAQLAFDHWVDTLLGELEVASTERA